MSYSHFQLTRTWAILASWMLLAGHAVARDSPISVANQYVAALRMNDFARLAALFLPDRREMIERSAETIASYRLQVNVIVTDSRHPAVWAISADGNWQAGGTMYITSEGLIKYDSVILQHPAGAANTAILWLLPADNVKCREKGLATLQRLKIPTFDFAADAGQSARNQAYRKIKNWWRQNLATFDRGDPLMPLSSSDYRSSVSLLDMNQTARQPIPCVP